MRVTLVAFMQVNPEYIYDHDWHVEIESDSEWVASAAMRSTKTRKSFHAIMDENNDVKCPYCNGDDEEPEILECPFCDGVGTVSIIAKRIYDSVVMGHYTIAGMTDFIFVIDDVSRSLTHQLVRHRTGWFLQQSTRSVNPSSEIEWYIVPPKIAKKPAALAEFMEVMDRCKLGYRRLRKMKIQREDCKFVLPQATKQRIIMKMDGSNLMHFFKLRRSNRAQWEIKDLADRIYYAVRRVCPNLFKEELREYWW